MGSKKKNIWNVLFLVLVFTLTIWSIFKGKDLETIWYYVKKANAGYLIISVVCVILFIWGESIIIFYMMKTLSQKIRAGRCFLYSFIGFFFSCITPSASGGQPAQIYYMRKDDIPIPVSTLVLMIVTITYKFVLVVIGIAILVIHPGQVMSFLKPVIFWCYMGIALNVFCVTAMFILVFHPSLAKSIMMGGLKLLQHIHFMKKNTERLKKLDKSMNLYSTTADYFRSNKIVVWNVFLITIAQRVILFFVTYFTYKAFGLTGSSMTDIVLCQAMISVAVDMLPLPGGMGISEQLFLAIFLPIFGPVLTLPAMLVSRGISYYSQLTISAVMTVVANSVIGKQKKNIKGECRE